MQSALGKKESGFTLIEMAIFLLILGLVTGAFFAYYTTMQQNDIRNATHVKQRRIAFSLGAFVQGHGRLPCPGRPDATPTRGYPLDYNATSAPAGNCGAVSDRVGIVPYRVLGLTEEDVVDGWGRPFTYAVDELSQNPGTPDVHNQCRTQASNITDARTKTYWKAFERTTGTYPNVPHNAAGTYSNLAPMKAIWCCRQNDGSDRLLVYEGAVGTTPVVPTQNESSPALSGADFAAVNVGHTSAPSEARLDYFSFVLVSHGRNGERSYVFGDANRRPATPNIGTSEAENGDDDLIYRNLPQNNVPGADYFDDILLWHTNRTLMASVGDGCYRP